MGMGGVMAWLMAIFSMFRSPEDQQIRNPEGGGDCNNSLLLLLPWAPASLQREAAIFCGPALRYSGRPERGGC